MKVIGLSFDFHDSSVALIDNGRLIFSSAEERFTRQKHDSHFPFFALRSALESTDSQLNEIDSFVFYENPEHKFSRLLHSSLQSWPLSSKEFKSIVSTWLGKKLWTKARIANKLDIDPNKIYSIPHHLSHAYQAFVGSGFSDSALLIMDAVGEWDSGSTYYAEWKNGKPLLTKISEMTYPHSVGLFYSAMTDFLGFKPMNDECTTMALAAFGSPKYYDTLKEILQLDSNGNFKLTEEYFNFNCFYKKPYTQKLIKALGQPRSANQKLSFSSLQSTTISTEEQIWADIACSVQKLTEEILLLQAQKLSTIVKSKNLSFAGGVALNCVANSRLLAESGFSNLHIPPEPGDGGASIGAAFAHYYQTQTGNPKLSMYTSSLGPVSTSNDVESILPLIKPNYLQKYRQLQSPYQEEVFWEWERTISIEELAVKTSQELLEGKIVGWFQGPLELGPRALGQRSILIRPDSIDLAKRLSNEVKIRAEFRPYALSMTPKGAEEILTPLCENFFKQKPLEWMQLAVPVIPEMQSQVRAGMHIDGTTRPQVIQESSHPYYKLIQEFGKSFGREVILNTSFNEKDYPIVASPMEALMMYARTNMDVLVIENLIIKKRKPNN